MSITGTVILLWMCLGACTAMQLQFVTDAATRGAVCNDGSPSGFYFEEGSEDGINTWVIHQAGGWACWDQQTCKNRADTSPDLISSKNWPSTMTQVGIFSTIPAENPTFYNANKVYIQYCSSDYWAGTRAPIQGNNFTDSWYFSGHNITRAIIEDLQRFYGMNSTSTEILFTGCSAGGKGVFANVDYVASYLNFTPAKFLGFSDEGWAADVVMSSVPYWGQFEIGWNLWEPQVNTECTISHPQHAFICFFGSVALPYISTPLIMTAQQYDIVQFGIDCGCTFNKSNTQDMMWMNELRSAFVSSFHQLRSPHTMFSPACATHCTSLGSVFTQITVDGISIAQLLTKFWEGNGNVENVIDTCPTFNCSVGCP